MNDKIDPSKILHLNEKFKKDAEAEMAEFANPLDFIIADRKKRQIEVSSPMPIIDKPSTPLPDISSNTQPKIPMIAIDGKVLSGDTITMVLYALVMLAKKDKKIAKLLKTFKFKMGDVNGEQIFP